MSQTSSKVTPSDQPAPLLAEILSTLSFALDLTEGAVPGHALRSCLLALRMGRALGLYDTEMVQLYYATLLKDVGCSSNSARMCQIIGGDDRAVKAGVKLEDWTQPNKAKFSVLKLMWTNVLPGESAFRKTQRILQIAATQHDNNREMIELRCDRGANIVRKIGLGEAVADAVRRLDEHWDGGGYPGRLRGHAIPLTSRIMCIAQHLDAFCSQVGPQKAVDVMVERSRRWFDPELVQAALNLHNAGRLWLHCMPGGSSDAAHAAVLQFQPDSGAHLSSSSIDQICEGFAEVVDAKSPFTYRHSIGVKDAAVAIGKAMGLAPARLTILRRAALLHDIGKLSVSNAILDKPGKLDADEFNIIKKHSAISRDILNRMPAFHEIALIAGEHHEKLDGSGYPYGLDATDLSLESRLLAMADVYGALSEDRPYRAELDPLEIARILKAQVPKKLDSECFQALEAAHQELAPPPPPVARLEGACEIQIPVCILPTAPAPMAAQRV